MIRRVRKLGVDAVVDMVSRDSVTSLFLSQFCTNQAWRIGRDKNRYGRYYDFNYRSEDGNLEQSVDGALKLLTAFGISMEKLKSHVPPTIRIEDRKAADEFLASLNGDTPGGIIGLNISAGRPTRIWQEEKNLELIDRLLKKYPSYRIIISSDPSDRARALHLSEKFPSRVDPLPRNMNLLEVSALIENMAVLITPDTSLVHIARSFKVPVVGLYTRHANNLRTWRPHNQKNGTVVSGNDYNIFDIEVNQVFDAVTTLLPPGDVT
jgi:ADP-heptose:LPS heptosyltransferase